MKPRVMIVGAGDTGTSLARRLSDNWEVTVVDADGEALQDEDLAGCAALVAGDGTSGLVLRRAGAEAMHALVASTDTDEVNLEVLRLGRELLGVESLYAVMRDPDLEPSYREAGAEVVDRHQTCAAVLESRIERRKVATGIGLGEGEIVEVEVLANSSVIGHRLADLRPRSWLVGAVYRDGRLIVPHGDTVIRQGDRVVLIGEPEILGAIATHIGTGESEFPLHYGVNVVAVGPKSALRDMDEVAWLFQVTAAKHLEVILPPGTAQSDELARRCAAAGIDLQCTSVQDDTPVALAREADLGDVGILLLPAGRLSFWQRVGVARSATATLISHLTSPALLCRGTFPYRRVLLALAEACFQQEAAQLAIDVARMVGADLHLCVVHQPELAVGAQLREEMEHKRRQIESLAGLYHVEVKLHTVEGNPIHRVVEVARDFDLLVLPHRRNRRSSLLNPDVVMNILHRAPCSTMIMST